MEKAINAVDALASSVRNISCTAGEAAAALQRFAHYYYISLPTAKEIWLRGGRKNE